MNHKLLVTWPQRAAAQRSRPVRQQVQMWVQTQKPLAIWLTYSRLPAPPIRRHGRALKWKRAFHSWRVFFFLRQAWKGVIEDGNTSWIDAEIAGARQAPNNPGSGIGPALERLVAGGALRDDISTVARIMQWQLLSKMCYLLSDPSIEERELQDTAWCLFEVDESGNVGRPVDGLHESVLETDPTGREMRP